MLLSSVELALRGSRGICLGVGLSWFPFLGLIFGEDGHCSSLSVLILFFLFYFFGSLAFLACFCLTFVSFTVDGVWVVPKSKLEPVEDIKNGKYKLYETQYEDSGRVGKAGVVLRLLVLYADVVKEGNEDADDDREFACHTEAIVHVALVDVLLHLQVVAVLDLTLHSFGVGEQGYDLVPMRVTGNLDHDEVSEVAGETAENWVVGEEDGLILTVFISNFNAEQETLKVSV